MRESITLRPKTQDVHMMHEIIGQDIFQINDLIHRADPRYPVIDGGAHIGCFTWSLLYHGFAGQIHTYEPYKPNFDLLAQNCGDAFNHRQALVPFSLKGVKMTMAPPRDNAMGQVVEYTEGDIPTLTVETLLDTFQRLSIVKLDLEGMEAQIVNDMDYDHLKRINILLIEQHHVPIDFKKLESTHELVRAFGPGERNRMYVCR